MALYCSREVFQALDGIRFPATRDDLLDYAELKDAREAVLVALNELPDDAIFHDISEVCRNARMACNMSAIRALQLAPFPCTREQLIEYAARTGAPLTVREALETLPSNYTFEHLDDVCGYIL